MPSIILTKSLLDYDDSFLLLLGQRLPASELRLLMTANSRLYNLYLDLIWKNISLCPPRFLPEHALEEHALEHPGTGLPQNYISPHINPNITNKNEPDLFLSTILNKDASLKALAKIETLELGPRYFYQREEAVKAMMMLSKARLSNLKMIQINLGCDRYKISKGAKNHVRNDTVGLMTKCMSIVHGILLHSNNAHVAIQACYPLSFASTFGSPVVCAAVRELGVTFNDDVETHSELGTALGHLTNLKILNIKTYNSDLDSRLPVLHYYQAPLRALKKLEQLGIASGSILNSFHAIHFPPNLKVLSLTITSYYGANPQLWKRILNRDFPKLESFYFAHSFGEDDFRAVEIADPIKISTLQKLSLARTPLTHDLYKRILLANRRLRLIEIKPDPELLKITLENCSNLELISGGKNVAMPSADDLKDVLTPQLLEVYEKVAKKREAVVKEENMHEESFSQTSEAASESTSESTSETTSETTSEIVSME